MNIPLQQQTFDKYDYKVFLPEKFDGPMTKSVVQSIFGEGTKVFFDDVEEATVFFTPKPGIPGVTQAPGIPGDPNDVPALDPVAAKIIADRKAKRIFNPYVAQGEEAGPVGLPPNMSFG